MCIASSHAQHCCTDICNWCCTTPATLLAVAHPLSLCLHLVAKLKPFRCHLKLVVRQFRVETKVSAQKLVMHATLACESQSVQWSSESVAEAHHERQQKTSKKRVCKNGKNAVDTAAMCIQPKQSWQNNCSDLLSSQKKKAFQIEAQFCHKSQRVAPKFATEMQISKMQIGFPVGFHECFSLSVQPFFLHF